MIYDINNLPVSIYKLSGQSQIYAYDVNGSRVQKYSNGGTNTYYVNDPTGKTEAVQTGTANGVYTYNIWGNDMLGQVKDNAGNLSRFYYLKDHLPSKIICMSGWRKALIGDIKMTLASNGSVAGYNDYYPFGMQMPGRNMVQYADGRYKFVGNERDVETGLDHNGDRSYDSWGERSLLVDPFASKDPSWSPYSYGHNCPIVVCDVNGDSVWVTWQTGFWSFLGFGTEHKALYSDGKLYENGQEYQRDADSYASKALAALNEINSGDAGRQMVSTLEGSKFNYDVNEARWYNPDNSFTTSWSGGNVNWDPSNTSGGIDQNGNTERPAYIGLAHELGHGFDWDPVVSDPDHHDVLFEGRPLWSSSQWYYSTKAGKYIGLWEKSACVHENSVRAEHKIPLREYYGDSQDGSPDLLK